MMVGVELERKGQTWIYREAEMTGFGDWSGMQDEG